MALFSNTSIYGTANVNSTLSVAAGIPSTSPTTGSVVVTGGAGVSGNVSATTVFSNNVDILNFAQAASAKANTNSTTQTIIQGVDATQNTNITATNTFTGSAYGQANTGTTLAQAAFTTSNTATGNLTALTAPAAAVGGSAQFNGSNFLQLSSSTANAFQSNNFTIEGWHYFTGTSTAQGVIYFNYVSAVAGAIFYGKHGGLGGNMSFWSHSANAFATPLLQDTATPMNTWTHYAIVRNGSTITMYKNGVSIATATYAGAITGATLPATEYIGAGNSGTNGYISNFRMVNGTAVYTGNFAPSTVPLSVITNTKLLTCQSSSTITDASATFTLTNNNGVTASAQTPFNPAGIEITQNTNITATNTMATAAYAQANTGTTLAAAAYTSSNNFITTPFTTGSVSFNGSTQSLSVPANSAFNFGTSNFTVECWFNIAVTGKTHSIYIPYTTGANYGQMALVVNGTANQVLLYLGSAVTNWNILSGGVIGTVTANQWYHVAVVRNGSSFTTYLNGVPGVTATSAAALYYPNVSASIGADPSVGATVAFNGNISNFRIVNGTALYNSAFTPSTAPLTAVTGTALLTAQSSSTITDASTNAFTITNNNGSVATTSNPFIGGSTRFNGTNNNLLTPSNTALDLTGDFTVEFWVNPSATTGTYLLNKGGGSNIAMTSYGFVYTTGNYYFVGSSNNSTYDIGGEGTAAGLLGAGTVGQWTHIAVSRQGNVYRGFINGVQTYTQTLALTPYTNTRGLSIGSNYATNWGVTANITNTLNGYMSNLRIVKGTALYTANFTPSTVPLTAITGTSLLTCQSATSATTDASTNAITITNNNSAAASGISPLNSGSAYGILSSAYSQANTATTLAQGAYNAANTGISGINVINDTNTLVSAGGSVSFNGTSTSYLSTNGAAFNNLTSGTTGDYTVEAWVYLTQAPTSTTYSNCASIISSTQVATTALWHLFGITSNGYITLDRAGINYVNLTATTPTLNTWNHIAFVNVGTTITVYLNGVSVGTMVSAGGSWQTSSSETRIGQVLPTAGYFKGYISNLRCVANQAVYTSNFTPSATLTAIPNTVLLTCQSSSTITDASTNAYTITNTGATVSAQAPSTGALQIGVNTAQNTNITAVNTFATSAYGQANTETTLAQAAYNAANTIPAMITNAQGVDATQNTNITATNTFATGAYGQANTGTTLAQAAFTAANSFVTVVSTVSANSYLLNQTNGISITSNPNGLVTAASTNFTVEFWFNLTASSGTSFNSAIVGGSFQNPWIIDIGNMTDGFAITPTGYKFQLSSGGSQSGTWSAPTGTSHHCAIVRTGGNTISIYLDGVLQGTPSTGTGSFPSAGYVWSIGQNQRYTQTTSGSTPGTFDGYVSNLRYVLGTALYTSNFTVPSLPLTNVTNTKLLTLVDSPTADLSSSPFSITKTGTINTTTFTQSSGSAGVLSSAYIQANTATTLAQGAFTQANTNIASINTIKDTNTLTVASGSASFGGTNYLSLGGSSQLALGSGNWTIEYWYYARSFGTAQVIYEGRPANTNGFYPSFSVSSTGALSFTTNGTDIPGSSAGQVVLNSWNHCAAVKNGSTTTMYLNGVAKGSFTDNNTYITGGAAPYIGTNAFGVGSSNFSINGYISNLRVVKGTAVYTTNFTPSATLTAIPNTVLLTCQSASSITDASTNALTITNSGATASSQAPSAGVSNIGVNSTQNNSINAVNTFATSAYGQANTATAASVYNQGVDATQNTNITAVNTFANAAYASANTKLPLAGSYTGVAGNAGGSIQFNGSNQYLTVSTNAGFSYDTGNFTIEAWTYQTSSGVQYGIIGSGDGATPRPYLYINGNIPTIFWNGVNKATGPAITQNTWTHIAVVRNGGNLTVYTNGVAGTTIPNVTDSLTNSGLWIGASTTPAQFFPGYISNLRVVKGTAVYTSSFTPSTAPLTAITGTQLLIGQSSSSITDVSPNAVTITNNGSTTASAQTPFTVVNTYSLAYPITGNLTINKDLQISGNLTSTGAVTSLNAVSTEVSDSLVELARNNTTGDTSDIGFAAQSNDGTTTSYSGVIRDAATKEFYVYQGYTGAVTGNNVDSTDASFAKGTLNAKQLKGSLIASSAIINGRELGAYTSTVYAQSNTGTTLAQAAFNTANTDAAAITVIQGTNTTQNTNIGAVNTLAGSAYATSNTGASAITVIQGVDAKQNTDIVSATTLAQTAFNYANTVLPQMNTSTTFSAITLNTNDGLTSGNVTANISSGSNGTPTWTAPATMNGSNTVANMKSVAVNSSGLFVAVGSGASGVPLYATSTDGSTWTTPVAMNGSSTSASIRSITVNSSGKFVAVGWDSSNAPIYATSTDGSTWTTPARMNGSSAWAQMNSVTVNSSGLFVAVGRDFTSGNAPIYATSTDGTTWTTPALMNGSTAFAQMGSITVNSSGKFVAVGIGPNIPVYATSTNGSTWTTPASMTAGASFITMESVAVNSSGLFVAVGNGTGYVPMYATSTDGSTWTTPAAINGSNAYAELTSISVNSSGLFVVIGADTNGAPLFATSTNGSTWTTPAKINGSNTVAYMNSIAVNSSGKFVAVGSNASTAPLYGTYTTSTGATGPTVIDSFSSNAYRSAKYEVQMTSGTSYHVIEVRVVTDGNNAWLTQYGDIHTGATLGTISGSMASGVFSLTVNPVNDGTVVRFYRSALKV